MQSLPAICDDLNIREADGAAVVNTRDVALKFGKRHADILRDTDNLLRSLPDAKMRSAFIATDYVDANGNTRPSFDLTRQGFTLLVMGWTGDKAMAFKVRYIEAFDAMEAALKSGSASDDKFILAVREIVAPLAVRFVSTDHAIERVERRLDTVADDVAFLKTQVKNGRRNLTADTKREHIEATKLLGAKCPCCGLAEVVGDDDHRLAFAEFDHFYQNSKPDAEHTWLICKPCHNAMSSGRVARDQREAEFRAYQNKRRRLPGRQITLFG